MFRSVHVGRFLFQPVLPSDYRPVVRLLIEWNPGQAINAVTGTRL